MTTATQNKEELIPTVPAFLLEAEEHRYKKTIKYLAVGWATSLAALAVPTIMLAARLWQ